MAHCVTKTCTSGANGSILGSMETLISAYQRLLAEVAQDMHATCGALVFAPESGASIAVIRTHDQDTPPAPDLRWLELPVAENGTTIAELRLGFAPDVGLPDDEEQRLAQALVELAVLLNRTRSQQSSASQASRRILAVTEEELQRIILDIHDGPVQKLFAASFQLEMMEGMLERLPEEVRAPFEAQLVRVASLLQVSLDEIKTTLGVFRPPEFRRRSLVSVLQGLVMQHQSLTGMQVEMSVSGHPPPVSLPVKIAVYRILQEALSNAYRHAKVENMVVHLTGEDGWVTLDILDHGPGFDPPPLEGPTGTEREEHIGLRGMRDRAELVGGQFRLTSQRGLGTRIQVRVPGDV